MKRNKEEVQEEVEEDDNEKKKGFSVGFLIIVVIILSGILLAAVLVKNLDERRNTTEYTILVRDCDIQDGSCDITETREKQNLTLINNITLLKEDLNDSILDINCLELDDNTWGCGKQIVLRN